MSLRYLITISGIFSKSDDLDILPPPTPFPEIGREDQEAINIKGTRKKEIRELKNDRNLEAEKRRESERKKSEIEKQRKLMLKRKQELKRNNKVLMSKRVKTLKKKTFEFFHGVGLVKTEQEKKEFERQRLEYKKRREIVKKKIEEDRKIGLSRKNKIRKESEKVKLEPEKKISRGKSQILSRMNDTKQKTEKRTIFGRIFGKKEKTEFDKILEKQRFFWETGNSKGISKLTGKSKYFQVRRKSEAFPSELKDLEKLEAPELKLPKIEKDKEEIQEAISGIKVKKMSFIPKSLIRRKEHAEEKIETPEVMPRTYDKIDYVEEIEEKMHKARLALMDFKFEEAKRVYMGIMRMYNQLEPKKRSKVYQDIKDLYYERKSAEKFRKK